MTNHPLTPEQVDLAASSSVDDLRQVRRIDRVVHRQSFAILGSVSEAGFAHSVGVIYESVGSTLYVHTMGSSRKARNVAGNGRVGVVIPIRRLLVGPPFTVQFQARAELVSMSDPAIIDLLDRGELKSIAGHGALDEPDGCFLRIEPIGPVHTYGIGVPMLGLIRDPLHAGARSVDRRALDLAHPVLA